MSGLEELTLAGADDDAEAAAHFLVGQPFDVVEEEDFPHAIRQMRDSAFKIHTQVRRGRRGRFGRAGAGVGLTAVCAPVLLHTTHEDANQPGP